MVKYKEAYEEMVVKHQALFEEFKLIHDKYAKDQETWAIKFDELGKPIIRIIEETENRLCAKMEGSNRGTYSANLADKFRQEVKKYLPYIDMVGVKVI
jgi:tRNA A37 N6-isopentenylltransferase MiaA